MVAGLLVMAAGALCFIPAASAPSFPLFLIALAIVAAGMTLLQVAANPYVVVLGPEKTASSRLNLAQAFNSLGTTVAPYIGSLFILGAIPLTAIQMSRLSQPELHGYRLTQTKEFLDHTTPSARVAVAAQLFLDRAATPPLLRGEPSPLYSDCSWRRLSVRGRCNFMTKAMQARSRWFSASRRRS